MKILPYGIPQALVFSRTSSVFSFEYPSMILIGTCKKKKKEEEEEEEEEKEEEKKKKKPNNCNYTNMKHKWEKL